MSLVIENLPEAIRSSKASLRKALPNYSEVFHEVEAEMRRKVVQIAKEREAGEAVIPILQYDEIVSGAVTPKATSAIRERGACVIRGVFPAQQVRDWDDEIGKYVEANGLDEKLMHRAEDKYFGTLASAKPQIYGIYWSRPQVMARQSESLTRTRVFLNKLWKSESEGRVHFDPEQTPVYADRIRRRPPGSASLGLSPHVDGGSMQPIARTCRRFPPRLFAQCSVRSRVGPRLPGRARETAPCS
jgi:hypothetical protein